MRRCIECGADISRRHALAKRCGPCARLEKRWQNGESVHEPRRAPVAAKRCICCGCKFVPTLTRTRLCLGCWSGAGVVEHSIGVSV